MSTTKPKRHRREAPEIGEEVVALASELEAPLAQAAATIRALELMGYGLSAVASDHGEAIVAVSEVATLELKRAKAVWRKLFVALGKKRAVRGKVRVGVVLRRRSI